MTQMGGFLEHGSTVSSRRDLAETRLRALTDIGRLAVTVAPESAVRAVVRAARMALGGASISLGVWEPEQKVLRSLINEGELAAWEEEEPLDEVYPADQSTWLAGMPDGHLGLTLTLADPLLPADERAYLMRLEKHSSLTVPVLLHGEWWGELFVARRADQVDFKFSDLDWASAVAAQVGAALEAVEHFDRVSNLARTDSLTGLANRRAVDEWMVDAVGAWRDTGTTVGLIVCDVNGLKKLNDAEGHDAGDRLLVEFASQLRLVAAEFEAPLLARLGGDEFGLAFQGVTADRIVAAAEHVCDRGWDHLPDGVACGVAFTGGEAGPVESENRLFRLADAAQYRAKRTQSRRPIVAGRALPPEAIAALADQTDAAPDRRLVRGRGGHHIGQLLDSALRALDQVAHEPARSRLSLVADVVSHHVDAVGWWLSLAPAGAAAVKTVEFAIYRQIPGLSRADIEAGVEMSFQIVDFPLTARALDGDAFLVRAEDPNSDPAELAMLDLLMASSVAAAGGVDADGDRWLLEVFADDLSGSLRDLPSMLRVLILAALHPPGHSPPPESSPDSAQGK